MRSFEISISAMVNEGEMVTAHSEIQVPQGSGRAIADGLSRALAGTFAAFWGFDDLSRVHASVIVVDSTREVVSFGDVRLQDAGRGGKGG